MRNLNSQSKNVRICMQHEILGYASTKCADMLSPSWKIKKQKKKRKKEIKITNIAKTKQTEKGKQEMLRKASSCIYTHNKSLRFGISSISTWWLKHVPLRNFGLAFASTSSATAISAITIPLFDKFLQPLHGGVERLLRHVSEAHAEPPGLVAVARRARRDV